MDFLKYILGVTITVNILKLQAAASQTQSNKN